MAENIQENVSLSKEESERIEKVIFEDGEEITLKDGKKYIIPPLTWKNARKLMKILKTINVDVVIVNFLDESREKDLMEAVKLAFVDYPEVTEEYLEENLDLVKISKILDILLGLNGIKK